jgi:class 3 adenylate cyclase
MPASPQQHTFVLADLAGYTALTEAHGDERAADAAAGFVRAVRELLADYDAEEVKAIGDALLLRLPSARDALELARRLVCEVGTTHAALGVRVGGHTGTAVQRDGDWFGSAVNLAARIADRANAGEVLLSGSVLAAAGRDVDARSHGSAVLKNVRQPVELYALALEGHIALTLAVDPVCHMALDPARAFAQEIHDGTAHFFCSAECAEAFRADPAGYAPGPP